MQNVNKNVVLFLTRMESPWPHQGRNWRKSSQTHQWEELYERTLQEDRFLALLLICSVSLVVKEGFFHWLFLVVVLVGGFLVGVLFACLFGFLQLNEFNFPQIRTEIPKQQINPSCLHRQLSKQTCISMDERNIVILEINVVFPVCFELDLHVSLLFMFVCINVCVQLFTYLFAVIYLFVCLSLTASVQGPWERAISPNKVPYYIKWV